MNKCKKKVLKIHILSVMLFSQKYLINEAKFPPFCDFCLM